jgi:hypothetical protein
MPGKPIVCVVQGGAGAMPDVSIEAARLGE